jgi:TonB-dependent receptor
MTKTLLLLFIFITTTFAVSAQSNLIKGTVTDESGEALPGVNVVVKGTVTGTATNLDGNYELVVLEKDATLSFSFIGYKTQEIALDGKNQIDAVLSFDTENLQEVVITAQAKGQKNAIRAQINSNTIKNVVASDRLQENPDANSVEAIGRLPGISVLRSGGEGSGLVVRGLEPKYTSVTLNGILMPSTGGGSRETNISSISQYALQEVEVFKALTPDMEANAVAGTVNLKLRETPKGLHYDAMAQFGYNNMNDYYGNYKFQGEVSNRFFNDKFGVFFSANAERVNRSTQTMSAGYGLESSSTENVDILINGINLNNISTIKYRRSAMLSMDYRLHRTTTLGLYGLYTYSKDDHNRQTKNYNVTGVGGVGYDFHDNPYRNTDIFQSALSALTKLDFLNLQIDYGVAYSTSITDDPDSRNWSWGFKKVPTSTTFSNEVQRLDPSELIPLFTDNEVPLENLQLGPISKSNSKLDDKNYTAYLDFKIPYRIGNIIEGEVKFGGRYRQKIRKYDRTSGYQHFSTNQFAKPIIADSLGWLVRDGLDEQITAVGIDDGGSVDGFLNGQYDFGRTFRFDRLNEITDTWDQTSNYWYSKGSAEWSKVFPAEKLGYMADVANSMMDDQDITENYYATYLMTEINFGKWVMFMPGIRFENTDAAMKGFKATKPTMDPPVYDPLPGDSTSATRSDKFWLPMVHMRVKPLENLYIHMAYTETLNRPDFNAISPNIYYNTGFNPFSIDSRNPDLRAEYWNNYDVQLTVHGDKIGLFSVSGFYKTVTDKIWSRSYKRLVGDPIIDPFPDKSQVNVTAIENHQYKIYLKGVEVELQTSFWYMPNVLKYFTFTANYTYTTSETQYPLTRVENIIPAGGGRPVPTRIDSTTTGPMLYQPKHIMNSSLGFNKGGTNVWLSFQYNGEINTGKNYQLAELDGIKENFYRWDLQVTQKLSGRLKGFEVVGNLANISDFMEKQRLRGDVRPTYLENYGWTFDLGVRYRF